MKSQMLWAEFEQADMVVVVKIAVEVGMAVVGIAEVVKQHYSDSHLDIGWGIDWDTGLDIGLDTGLDIDLGRSWGTYLGTYLDISLHLDPDMRLVVLLDMRMRNDLVERKWPHVVH